MTEGGFGRPVYGEPLFYSGNLSIQSQRINLDFRALEEEFFASLFTLRLSGAELKSQKIDEAQN